MHHLPVLTDGAEASAIPVEDGGKPLGCVECPRHAGYTRCRASTPRHESGRAEILFVFTQPQLLDATAREYGVGGDLGSVVQEALFRVYQAKPENQKLWIRRTYAAQCVGDADDDKPGTKILQSCSPRLNEVIAETQPKLIVAFGATALKQLGVPHRHSDVRGRVLEPTVTGLAAPVLVTFSDRQLPAAPGIFSTFLQDLHNGFARVHRGTGLDTTLVDISKSYRYPKTIDEAIALCEEIRAYSGKPDVRPDNWLISVDTETTSLRPEKDGTKVIAFCFAWGTGLSTTILFDHPHAPPEYLERLPELREAIARLLDSPKPKVFHNAKFDLKWVEFKYKMPVRNVVWCTLLGEHLLDEDKKGNYGLKALTAVWIPRYCGYEDKLFDILEATDMSELGLIDEKLSTVTEEHAGYGEALVKYRESLVAYQARKAAWEAEKAAYQVALDEYAMKMADHKLAIEAWEARPKRPKKPTKPLKTATEEEFTAYAEALKAYDAWTPTPRPVKDFERPEKPPALEKAPEEPEDPRSKKERDYNTDAGFEKVPLDDLQTYGAVDGDVTRQLCSLQIARLQQEAAAAMERQSRTRALMRTHAIPASRVLGAMEFYGTRIDQAYIVELDKALTDIVDKTTAELFDMLDGFVPEGAKEFNLNSAAHLAEILYGCGWKHPTHGRMPAVECLDFTKKQHKPAVTEKALKPYMKYDKVKNAEGKEEKIPKPESLFLDRLFLRKKALKARDTFLENLRVLSKRDSRIHTSFHINGTGTGRLSSSDMNLQNIPKKLAGWSIKRLFVPDSDEFLFVNADYKGAEVRVFTAYARDKKLIDALNSGLDMHSYFASMVNGRPYEDYQNRENKAAIPSSGSYTVEVDKTMQVLSGDAYRSLLDAERTAIKRTVFGILYGAGPGKIAETIGKDKEEAQKLIDRLFEMFPAIKGYIDEIHATVYNQLYVETLFGRRRRFPLARSSRHKFRAQRQACNFNIQSTSSDIVIGQIIEMHEMIHSNKTWPEWGIHEPLHTMGVRLLLTVHDSVVLQWPKKIARALKPWLKYYGEQRVREKYSWLPVPFAMDIEVGDSYGELKPIDAYYEALPHEEIDEGLFEEQELLNELREDAFEGIPLP